MSFRHIALFRWQPGTTPEQIDPIAPALDALAATLNGVESYVCGPGLGLTPTSYDFAVVSAFTDKASWEAYIDHPEHVRVRDDLILPIAADRAGIQLEA